MTPEQIDRVFGRGRLRMVTGEHVEVFREAVAPGERRRYTKRFLNSTDGNFAHWTEREWRILARLIGHGIGCVPDVVQFDRGLVPGTQLVQTYDAGVTVDQWATLLPLYRDGHVYRHMFEDCAHWWALAHHCLAALKEIHQLRLVHLDVKGDNVCIPYAPASFDPDAAGLPLHPSFDQLALIDFAFSLVSGENLTAPLPIGRQVEYDYQSPRLLAALEAGHGGDLRPTRELDWRCDIYSLAAMLDRYLPDDGVKHPPRHSAGWTSERYDAARCLILALREHHDRDATQWLPHAALIDVTSERLRESDLARSLAAGWTLARDVSLALPDRSAPTPMTRIAPPIRVLRRPRGQAPMVPRTVATPTRETAVPLIITRRSAELPPPSRRSGVGYAGVAIALTLALGIGGAVALQQFPDAAGTMMGSARAWVDGMRTRDTSVPSASTTASARSEPAVPEPASAQGPDTHPTATVAEVPQSPPADAAPDPVASTQAKARAEGEADLAASGSAEPVDSTAIQPGPAPDPGSRPGSPRMSSKAAPPAGETPRAAAGRRAPTKTPPPTAARPSTPTATAKPPASRFAKETPRTAPTIIGLNTSPAATRPSPTAPRAEHAPASVQLWPLAPQPGQSTPVESPRPAPEPAETPAPSSTAVTPAPPASAPDSTAAAAPKSSAATRRSRVPSAGDEWRAGIGYLSQLFGLAKRKAAPIEDRTLQDAPSEPKPSRATQAPAPLPDPPVPPPAKVEVPSLAFSGMPPPRVVTPQNAMPDARIDYRPSERTRETDFAREARRTLAQTLPRIAVQVQAEIAPVLWAAANAHDPRQEREVVDYAQAIWVRDDVMGYPQVVEPAAARRLNDEAMQAYRIRRNVAEAFDLSLKAFGANPNDPEIAGNLAFLHLRLSPAQPETARQLALHALAVRGSRFRTGRLEDWNTYALASALTGRDADARNAMYVTVALAGSVERNCKAGQLAIAHYGERVREPVEAMLYRIYTQGRAYESPYCAWPPTWSAGLRRP